MVHFGCPKSKDPNARDVGTGGPNIGSTYKNLATGEDIMREGTNTYN